MSTFRQVTKKCFMCGKESTHHMLVSTSAFGSMDLDTRPPALARHANNNHAQMCPHCGYANYTIDTETSVPAAFLQSESYLKIAKQQLPEVAMKFCRHAMIGKEENDAKKEFWGYMRAAWACDDEQKDLSARVCRLCALDTLNNATTPIMNNEDSAAIMRADLLRRTQQFDEVVKQFDKYQSNNDFLQKLIRYEVKLAKAKDAECHSVDEG